MNTTDRQGYIEAITQLLAKADLPSPSGSMWSA